MTSPSGSAATAPPLPPYGDGTLADVLPAAAGLLGSDVAGTVAANRPFAAALRDRVGDARRVVVFLVDGCGAELLAANADVCPTLSAATTDPRSAVISTCFPSTTVTSLVSFGTGATPGEHGMIGYSIRFPAIDTVVNCISFTRYGDSRGGSLADVVVPEQVQPVATVFERLGDAGVPAFQVNDAAYEGSGLTRAAFRGAGFVGWGDVGEGPAATASLVDTHDRCLVYTYMPDVDRAAHMFGTTDDRTVEALAKADALTAELRDRLPDDVALLVTGDHGLVDIPEADRIDLDDEPTLRDGVVALSGEPRARYVHVQSGAQHEVAEAWRDRLGDRAWVRLRDEAIREGWFGPKVTDTAARRIGDVVVAFRGPGGIVQPRIDPMQARLVGHHGSLTPAEARVPLLVVAP
jgi:hypothetical protein